MTDTREVDVHVPMLARVEGEGALHLRIRAGEIERLQLEIYEPPRLFEKFLEGRSYAEVPDLVARICGICPVAYQVSAAQAFERLFGIELEPRIAALRRLLYCGEWIESHCLHIHLLAAPDYFGYDNAIAMSADHPEIVQRGMKLHAVGNALMELLGARAVHPVGLRVGGFHRAPTDAEADALLERVREALPDAEAMLRWTTTVPVPDDPQTFTSVALRAPAGYAVEAGRIVSDAGLDIDADAYEGHFAEQHVAHSTALYSLLDGRPYLVGPLARLNVNADRLPARVAEVLDETGVQWPGSNMFHSMVARAAEVYLALLESERLLADYHRPARSCVEVEPRAGTGCGVSEAPRGILWHRYEVDGDGRVLAARIVPPTSQNQARIEQDLHRSLAAFGLDHDDATLRLHCEKVIRNYDPCISCATHFLRLTTERC